MRASITDRQRAISKEMAQTKAPASQTRALAGHDGENDPGQLESSLRARAQLEKEGFPSKGDPDYLHSEGVPGLWLQSLATGHGTIALKVFSTHLSNLLLIRK